MRKSRPTSPAPCNPIVIRTPCKGAVDSHCHLNYLDDADARLAAARAAGVHRFLCIGVNAETHDPVIRIAEHHADVWASAGLHPESAASSLSLDWVSEAARHERIVGLGETGLDYFKVDDDDVRRRQRDSFAAHLGIDAVCHVPLSSTHVPPNPTRSI